MPIYHVKKAISLNLSTSPRRLINFFQLRRNYFSTTSTIKPSKAFIALQEFERQVNTEEPFISRVEYIKKGFHPSYFLFANHIRPDIINQTKNKLQFYKSEILNSLNKDLPDSKKFSFDIKPGTFYIPYTTQHGINAIKKASDQQIANARCLLALPIFARKEEEILEIITQYRYLLKFANNAEMQQRIPKGVIVYAADNHPRLIEELRTLEYLEQSDMDSISPWELGYNDVYKKFIEPKLITLNGLTDPKNFIVNMITSSYTNRLFDQLMGMIHETVLIHKKDPSLYLKNCYGFHLIANPYNFNKIWMQANDWRSNVIKHVSSDIIWNFSDIATRIKPEHELLLSHFRKFDNNIIRLASTQRQAAIIVTPIRQTYENLSPFQTSAALLGHDLSSSIEYLHKQIPELPQALRAYLTNEATKTEFDIKRQLDYTYSFDVLTGIPINHLLHQNEINLESLIFLPVKSPYFLYDVYSATHDFSIIDTPCYFSERIMDKNIEDIEKREKFNEWNEIHLCCNPLEWFSIADKNKFDIAKSVLVEHYLASTIKSLLEKNPMKKKHLQKFFEACLDMNNWDFSYDEKNKRSFIYEILNLGPENKPLSLFKMYSEIIQDEKLIKPYLREILSINSVFNTDFYIWVMERMKKKISFLEKSAQQQPEFIKLFEFKEERNKQLAGNRISHFKLLLRITHIKPCDNFTEGKKILWECMKEAIKILLKSGEMTPAYCAILRDNFAYTVGIKLRAANLSYTKYIKYFSENSKNKPHSTEAKPITFNRVLKTFESPLVDISRYKLLNESDTNKMILFNTEDERVKFNNHP